MNFAVAVYPAYVFAEDGDGGGGDGGEKREKRAGDPLTGDFAFDAGTPPICFIHGDGDDDCSPAGSLAVYEKLREMKIPAELHIYAGAGHGFGAMPNDDHVGDWLNRVYCWMKAEKFWGE